jgi:hypothetical protein
MPVFLSHRWLRAGLAAPLLLLAAAPAVADPLPFDPLPSGFERWLNTKRDWPHQQRLHFDGLAQCADQTASRSPYRMPVYTCLKGELMISEPGKPERTCALQRVSYFPTNARVRYWTSTCRPH